MSATRTYYPSTKGYLPSAPLTEQISEQAGGAVVLVLMLAGAAFLARRRRKG